MSKTMIPQNYTPALNLYDTQRAIGTVKRLFADTLCATLNLYRVSAPLFLEASTGLNDDLNGVERKVTFDIRDSGIEAQVVQSLAKWKRKALKDYGFRVGKGLYCDMNAIRRDEELDNLHLRLCGPVGLGEGHPQGGPQRGLPEERGALHRVGCLCHRDEPARHVPPAAGSAPSHPPT